MLKTFLLVLVPVALFATSYQLGAVDVSISTADALVQIPEPSIVSELELPAEFFIAEDATATSTIAIESQAADSLPAVVKKSGAPTLPARLLIPAIGLDSEIQYVGQNSKGEMDVPSGETNYVGWYQKGTVPGKTGSAVFAAHVFAAFSDLDRVPVGADIYVDTNGGERLHFVVEAAKTYELGSISSQTLFNRKDDQRLNLITCAGTFVKSLDTYDHRLVVYATLV